MNCQLPILTTLLTSLTLLASEPLQGPPESLFTADSDRWVLGLNLGLDRRSFKVEERVEDIDVLSFWANAKFEPHPAVQVRAEMGTSKFETDDEDGETGLRLGGAIRAGFLSFPLEESPTAGIISQLRFGGELQARFVESNLDEADFNYTQVGAVFDLSYDRNRLTEAAFGPFRAAGTSWRTGIAFLSADGELGPVDIETERNFALELGVAHGWTSRWVSALDGRFFSSGDREIWLSTNYRF